MRVLLTRPSEDAGRTARELAKRGHQALLAPLSETRFLGTAEPDLAGIQALLFTSSNGVRAFARVSPRRDIRVFAVGENTAYTARAAGFRSVSSADGDSSALATVVSESLNPSAGALLHLRGRRVSGELQRKLAAAGFEYRVVALYEVVAHRTLPEETVAAFRQDAVDAVLVFSPESGRMLVEAIGSGGVAAKCDRIVACCISEAAAAKIQGVRFGAIRIAEHPTLDAVLALLDSGGVSARCQGRQTDS